MKSPYVRHLEDELARVQAENRLLLDRLLVCSGIDPLTVADDRDRGPTPRRQPARPWHRAAALEAKSWDEFNKAFGVVNMAEVLKEKEAS